MSKDNKSPTPLSVMLGDGDSFIVKGKSYSVKPIALKDIEEFMSSNINLGSQLFSVADKKEREKIDRWLGGKKNKDGNIVKAGYCFDSDGNPVNLEKAMNDGWDIVDLKLFLRKLCDLSG